MTLDVDVMMAVGERMSGRPLAEDVRPFVEQMANDEGRVVLRCRPYATFATPPRHLHRNDQEESITHWLSASVPWSAADEVPSDSSGSRGDTERNALGRDRRSLR